MADIRLNKEEANGGLPDVCMCCGEEAETTVTKNMSWYPPWVNVLILVAVPVALIVSIIMTKRATLKAPLCSDHKGHWFKRTMIIVGSLFVFGFVGIAGFAVVIFALTPAPGPQGGRQGDMSGLACIFPVAVFIAWLVLLVIVQNTAIRAKEITDDELVLTGVSQEFADAMDAMERKRRKRLRRRDDDDEDDEEEEPRPRKKRPASDAIEEERPRRRREAEEIEEDRPRKKRRPADDDE